jgi:hypothetical protein
VPRAHSRRSLHQQLTNYEAIHKDSLSQLVAMSQDLAAQAQAARQHRQQQASLQQQVGSRGAGGSWGRCC